jgi:hypothetical protein
MPKTAAEQVGSAEEFLLPYERMGESAEDAGKSLFDAMESAGVEFDDLDEPVGDDEPQVDAKKSTESDGDDEDDDSFEDLDDLPEGEDDEFEDEEEFEEDSDDDFEDDEEQDEGEDADLIEVTLPGGEKKKVTREEAAAGYSRTEDYTRKRQRDAAEHAAAMESLRGIRERYDARLEKLNEVLESSGPKKPDPALRKTNPGEFVAQEAEYEKFQAQLEAVGTERGSIDAERQKELADVRAAIIEQERGKLFDAVPEWKTDEAKAGKELADLAKFAVEAYGFTPEQLDTVVDHRLLLMLRENKVARDRRAKGKKKLEGKKKAAPRLEPGPRKPRRGKARNEAERMRQKMAQQGGSMREHARLLELELGDDL